MKFLPSPVDFLAELRDNGVAYAELEDGEDLTITTAGAVNAILSLAGTDVSIYVETGRLRVRPRGAEFLEHLGGKQSVLPSPTDVPLARARVFLVDNADPTRVDLLTRPPADPSEFWEVGCGCAQHGDHSACDHVSCDGCVQPVGVEVIADNEMSADAAYAKVLRFPAGILQ